MDAYEHTFDTFKEVEEMAETVRENTSDNVDGSNCYKISNAIKTFNAYSYKAIVLKQAKKAFKFLYESRRGFYCSICDADSQ